MVGFQAMSKNVKCFPTTTMKGEQKTMGSPISSQTTSPQEEHQQLLGPTVELRRGFSRYHPYQVGLYFSDAPKQPNKKHRDWFD